MSTTNGIEHSSFIEEAALDLTNNVSEADIINDFEDLAASRKWKRVNDGSVIDTSNNVIDVLSSSKRKIVNNDREITVSKTVTKDDESIKNCDSHITDYINCFKWLESISKAYITSHLQFCEKQIVVWSCKFCYFKTRNYSRLISHAVKRHSKYLNLNDDNSRTVFKALDYSGTCKRTIGLTYRCEVCGYRTNDVHWFSSHIFHTHQDDSIYKMEFILQTYNLELATVHQNSIHSNKAKKATYSEFGSDTNVTDKSVSREKEKSRLNENATAEKEDTMDCSANDEKPADAAEIDVDKDSGGAENKLVIPRYPRERKMRVCLKRLLVPFCHNCERHRNNTRGWVRRKRSECLICGGELAYSCRACEYENSSLRKAIWHVKSYCSEKLWRCYKCPYASFVEDQVKAHIEYNHSDKENEDGVDYLTDKWGYYQCGICRKGFRIPSFLRVHEKYCGVERTVRIVDSENNKPKRSWTRKKKEPAPSVVEEVKKNADEFIKLHCYKCNLTFEKGKKEKKCDKCVTPLLWQCVKCSTKSKSYCGLYDHVNSCTNEIAQLILV